LHHPWAFIILLVLSILLIIWLLPRLWRGIRKAFSFLGRLLGRPGAASHDAHTD
jgi:hypothetical protein